VLLRPCTVLDDDGGTPLAAAIASASSLPFVADPPPVQFLHVDDLVSAIDVAWRSGLDGPVNVAPDRWMTGETVQRLSGAPPTVPLNDETAGRLATLGWRFQRGPIPSGLLPYVMAPWVVANDRLHAAGWRPAWTNEEAYVAGTEPRWWTMLTPQRKQELALAISGSLLAGAGVGAVLLARRAFRSPASRRA
jgi:hypothetical protein